MKLAVLSDIHSNVFALQGVLSDVEQRSADVVVNLGDSLYGPIAPKATYEELMKHSLITISGNQDRQIHEATPKEIETNPTMRFILEDLGHEPVHWMKSLPFDCQFTDKVYLCHGTPASDVEYLLEDVESGYPRVRSDDQIKTLLASQSSDLILCGHTHLPRTVLLNTGQLVVNPGSVGLPAFTDNEPVHHSIENFSPHASYAILEGTAAGWSVQQIKVAYDHHRAAETAADHGRSDWAHFIATGRITTPAE